MMARIPPIRPAICGACLVFLTQTQPVYAQEQTTGLFDVTDPSCAEDPEGANCPTEGFTLLRSALAFSVHLIDNQGRIVHQWHGTRARDPATPLDDDCIGLRAILTKKGNLLLNCTVLGTPLSPELGAVPPVPLNGLLLEYDWDGNLIWAYDSRQGPGIGGSEPGRTAHHDFLVLPNGNIVFLQLQVLPDGKLDDEIVEIAHRNRGYKPDEPKPLIVATDADIVWKWRLSDHSFAAADDADARANPQLWDTRNPSTHQGIPFNGLETNRDFDQLIMTSPQRHELFVIDHSTTTAEAAGHTGGSSGKGGDFLYRWGNAANYGHTDAPIFLGPGGATPHAPRLIRKQSKELGYKDTGMQMPLGLVGVFNNGPFFESLEPTIPFSKVTEFLMPIDENGLYHAEPDGIFGPLSPHFELDSLDVAGTPTRFFSVFISNAQRLPNGRYLINEGIYGVIYEATLEGDVVWKFVQPVVNDPTASPAEPDTILGKYDEIPDAPDSLQIPGAPPFQGNLTFQVERYSEDYEGFRKVAIPGEQDRPLLTGP